MFNGNEVKNNIVMPESATGCASASANNISGITFSNPISTTADLANAAIGCINISSAADLSIAGFNNYFSGKYMSSIVREVTGSESSSSVIGLRATDLAAIKACAANPAIQPHEKLIIQDNTVLPNGLGIEINTGASLMQLGHTEGEGSYVVEADSAMHPTGENAAADHTDLS